MTKKKQEEEPEVITFKEFYERNKHIEFEELSKFVLVCKNCSHKDLLGNFIKKRKKSTDWNVVGGNFRPDPKSWKPSRDINPWKQPPFKRYQIRNGKTTKKQNVNSLILNDEEYEDMFYCPKCGSSLIVMDKEFTKNNILRGLSEK